MERELLLCGDGALTAMHPSKCTDEIEVVCRNQQHDDDEHNPNDGDDLCAVHGNSSQLNERDSRIVSRAARQAGARLTSKASAVIQQNQSAAAVTESVATFYAHFKNKEQLLATSVGRLRKTLERAYIPLRRSGERLAFSLAFFRHLDSHRRIYHAMVGRDSQVVVEHYLRRMLLDLVKADLRTSGSRMGKSEQDVLAHFTVGGMWSVVVWWLDSRSRLSAEQIHEMFLRLALKGIDGKN